jgi:hypothetical protein
MGGLGRRPGRGEVGGRRAEKGLFKDSSMDVWADIIGAFASKGDPEALAALVAKLDDPEM